MTRHDFTELFEMRIRGVLAAAFSHSNVEPTERQWAMLRGDVAISMRDIGEIGYLTGHDLQVALFDRGTDQ